MLKLQVNTYLFRPGVSCYPNNECRNVMDTMNIQSITIIDRSTAVSANRTLGKYLVTTLCAEQSYLLYFV